MSFKEFEKDISSDIVDEIKSLGFRVKRHPRLSISGYRPDLLVYKGDKRIAIEIKTRPISPSEIMKLSRLPVDQVIICAPRPSLSSTASSVSDYASQSRIILCDIGEIGFILAGQ